MATKEERKAEGIEKIIADADRMRAEDQAKKIAEAAGKTEEESVAAKAKADADAKAAADAEAAKKAEADKAAAAKEAEEAAAKKPAAETKTPASDDDDDFAPDEKGQIAMPMKAFQKRLSRAASAQLKELFGTDDHAKILQIKKDADALAAKTEEERKAKQTEIERERERAEKAEAKAREYEERERAREEAADADAEEKRVTAIAAEFLDPSAMEFAHFKFAKHLKKKSPTELAAYTDEDVRDWYKGFADKNPRYAKVDPVAEAKRVADEAAAQKAAEEKKVVRPLSVGSAPAKPAAAKVDPKAVKSVKDMSPSEYNEYKRKNGISY